MNIIKTFAFTLSLTLSINLLTAFETIEPGILKVAVTQIPVSGENAPGWTLDFLQEFEKAHHVKVEFSEVPFDNSWSLAAEGKVDLVATGLTVLEERQREASTFTNPYLQVKRGLRIHGDESHRFSTIEDFIGYRVGAVAGMTAYYDLLNRAPEDVEIVTFDSWDSMYASFYNREIEAVAEGYYVSVSSEINHKDEDYPMIDDHDLVPGQPEYLAFAVRNKSSGLLEAINDLLKQTGFPISSEWKK